MYSSLFVASRYTLDLTLFPAMIMPLFRKGAIRLPVNFTANLQCKAVHLQQNQLIPKLPEHFAVDLHDRSYSVL